MGNVLFLYPFHGKKASLNEISKYYRYRGIAIDKNQLNRMIKQKADRIGRNSITEEMLLDMVKEQIYRKVLSTVNADFKANCIKEFGEDFWDILLKRKEEINKSKNFRRMMKLNSVSNEGMSKKQQTAKEMIQEKEERSG